MKKLFATIALVGVLASSSLLFAQDDSTATQPAAETPTETASVDTSAPAEEEATFHELLKDLFIQGGPGFMTPILICMIIGLA
ncbi:MAG TPA: MotA/TolQ/ExbB proton channel family protein, partial [Chryseolinea sp.]